ncbi:MAG: SGNH/GDSL hydrolase family protein [Rhodothermales bacterium]
MLRLLAINLAVTAGLLLGIEGCVRLALPEIRPLGSDARLAKNGRFGSTPGLRPYATGRSGGVARTVDAEGFWQYAPSHERAGSPLPGWLFLGDSVTMGPGVAADSTFAGRVAAALDTTVVLNPSLIGYQAADYVTLLDALLNERPDIGRVTVFWCLNDAYAPRQWVGTTAPTVRASEGLLFDFLRRHVRTYQWAKATFADRPLAYYRHDRAFYTSDSAFASAASSLRALDSIATEHGVRLDLVALPYEAQLRADAPADSFEPQRRLREAAAAEGLPFYDAAEAFDGVSDPAALYRYGDGIHFSERGHALLARYLRARL